MLPDLGATVGVVVPSDPSCVFCAIATGGADAHVVFRGETSMAFLDTRPLFPGHTLLMPIGHVETLADLPADDVGPLFGQAQRLAGLMESALGAHGSFVALNNRVSQSVPHLHVHVVPRRRKDGLRGFFWPRTEYEEGEAEACASLLADAWSVGSRRSIVDTDPSTEE